MHHWALAPALPLSLGRGLSPERPAAEGAGEHLGQVCAGSLGKWWGMARSKQRAWPVPVRTPPPSAPRPFSASWSTRPRVAEAKPHQKRLTVEM